jgi:hypothetical protein
MIRSREARRELPLIRMNWPLTRLLSFGRRVYWNLGRGLF